MASLTPAQKADEARRKNELLAKEAGIQENLLGLLQKQASEYANAEKKLKSISAYKQILQNAQDDLNKSARNIDLLENNILKRNQKIIEQRTEIEQLTTKSISSAVKRGSLTDDEILKINRLKSIWKDFKTGQNISGNGVYTKDQLKIIREVAAIENISSKTMKYGSAATNRKLLELIVLSKKQSIINKGQKTSMLEELALDKERIMLAQNIQKTWIQQLPFVQSYKNKLEGVTDAWKSIGGNVGGLTKMMEGPLLLAGAGLLFMFTEIFNIFNEFDKAAWDSRKAFGMIRSEQIVMREQAERITSRYTRLGVTVDMTYKTQLSISKELGSQLYATENIVTQASLMSAQFGITEDTTIRMLKTLAQVGGTTISAQTNMVGFSRVLSAAAEVPLPLVMDDIAKASETTFMMMSKLPTDLIKAAVEARRMGSTLDKMTASSRKLLNFTESIDAEMEASVLLGTSINLQLVRQLAYKGKIIESNNEILKISKQINFEKLDVFTQEAYARATGKSVDEILSMVVAERQFRELQNRARLEADRGNLTLQHKLDVLEKIKKANKDTAESMGKNDILNITLKENQSLMESISNSWKQVKIELGGVFLPLIDLALKALVLLIPLITFATKITGAYMFVTKPLELIYSLLNGTLQITQQIGISAGPIVNEFFKLKDIFLGVTHGATLFEKIIGRIGSAITIIRSSIISMGTSIKWIGTLTSNFGKVITFIGRMFGLLKFALPFTKAIPIIGWIITGVQFIYSLVTRLLKIDWSNGFLKGIVDGLGAVTGAVYDVLIQPFVDVYDWIMTHLGAHSPSEIGLSIVRGITAIGSMLYDVITNPFKRAWEFVTDLFSQKFLKPSIETTIKQTVEKVNVDKNIIQPSISKPIMELKNNLIDIPVDRPITNKEVKSYRELNSVPYTQLGVDKKNTTNVSTLDTSSTNLDQQLLNEIKGLRSDLLSGKIAVNIDGQLMTTSVNRSNKFRGNYGAIQ